jgi:WD40 repeat protein
VTGKPVRQLAGHDMPVRAVAFAPDGKALATGAGESRDGRPAGEVKVWDAKTGRVRRTLAVAASDVNAVAFSPDGRTLVAGGLKGLWAWDADTGELRHHQPSSAAVLAIAFAPDGRTLASGAFDGDVRLWDTTTWAERRALTGHRSEVRALAFAPGGKELATGGVGEVILWDADTGERRRELKPGATAWAAAFTPDGKRLVVGVGDPKETADGGVQVWDAATGERLRSWSARGGAVGSAAFGAGGKTLATGRYDGTVTLWDLAGARK